MKNLSKLYLSSFRGHSHPYVLLLMVFPGSIGVREREIFNKVGVCPLK